MSSLNLRFGIENQVPNATLSSSPTEDALTPLDWLKTEWRARKVVYTNPAGEITITGQLDDTYVLEYFVLSGIEHEGTIEVKFIAYSDGLGTPVEEFASDYIPVSDIPPLGEWRAGIDPYGVAQDGAGPLNYVVWLDVPVAYDKFEILIRGEGGGSPGTVSLTTAMAGHKLEMERNFSHGGNAITFTTPPSLVRVAGGNFVPARAQRRSRTLTLSLPMMTDQDRARLRRMEVGELGRPFLVSCYPDDTGWQYADYNFIGRFADALRYGHVTGGMHGTAMTIVEA